MIRPVPNAAAVQLDSLHAFENKGGSYLMWNTSFMTRAGVALAVLLFLAVAPARLSSIVVPGAAAVVSVMDAPPRQCLKYHSAGLTGSIIRLSSLWPARVALAVR